MASFLTEHQTRQASYHRIVLLLRALMTVSKAWRLTACAALAMAGHSPFASVAAFVLPANPPISTDLKPLFPKLNVAANMHRPSTATSMLPATGAAAAAAAAAVSAAETAVEATETTLNVLRTGLTSSSGSAAGLPSWAPVLSSGIMDDMDPTKLGLFAFAGLGVAAAGFQTAVYWRMQYVVAALLTNRVPPIQGGAEVLELSAKDTKTLYYMPTGGVRRLTLSTVKDLQSEIVNGAAIQAKIPTALVRKQEGGKLSCNSGTMDCVVSIYGFSGGVAADKDTGAATVRGLAAEVARVLKPGGTLLFVEKGEAKELVEELQAALGTVEVNMVKNLVDPYCVALGTKTKDVEDDERTASGSKAEGGGNRRERRGKKKAAKSRGD